MREENDLSVEAAPTHGNPRDVCDHRPGAAAGRAGIHLSREQVFRLVTTVPQRLSLDTLAALCDILDVGVEELIEITAASTQVPKTVGRHQ